MNEEPIPRQCKTIEDAIELIEAMRQDGEHGFEDYRDRKYHDQTLLVFVWSFRENYITFGTNHIWSSGFTRNQVQLHYRGVSPESIRLLWLFMVARFETEMQINLKRNSP